MIGMLVKGHLIQDCRGPAVKMICKPQLSTGNFSAVLIEGNACVGNAAPQIQVVGSSKNLAIRNNLEAVEEL